MSNSTTADRLEVAHEIIRQLGGAKFQVMVGMRLAMSTDLGVQFRIGGGAKNGINCVRIDLTPADDYTVTFYKIRGMNAKAIQVSEGVYCDGLRQVFEMATGMATRL